MGLRLGWAEEVLSWISTDTNTMSIKMKDMVNPDSYRGRVVERLVHQHKHFFKEMELLRTKLEEVSELAGELTAIADLCGPDDEQDEEVKSG